MKHKIRQANLYNFGLEMARPAKKIKKQESLEKQIPLDHYGLSAKPKIIHLPGSTQYRRVVAQDLYNSLLQKQFKQTLLGQGKEFQVYDLQGLKFGVVLKKQRKEFSPKQLRLKIKAAKKQAGVHKRWGETGLNVPILMATQIRFNKRPAHVFERVIPLIRVDFERKKKEIVPIPNRLRFYPAKDICKALPGIVEQFKIAEEKKILMDSMLENFGISKTGIVYLDTFHEYDDARQLQESTCHKFGVKNHVWRFLASCKRYYKNPHDFNEIKATIISEVTRQFGPEKACETKKYLIQHPPSFKKN